LAAFMALNGQVTIGMFLAILQYFSNVNNNISIIMQNVNTIQNRLVAIQKVIDYMSIESEEDELRTDKLLVDQGRISFNDVSFYYNKKNNVLDNINLNIRSGERISLVGSSGAGKTTISSLLLGFYIPQSGSISIDEHDLRQCTLKSIRNEIGIVQQEVLMFDGTLRMNMTLGNKHATDNQIMEACEMAAIGDFVRSLPDGLDTVMGKNATDFSGGQRQRLAIARIYLKNPKILIFDEATSSLDYESEKLVHEAWDNLSRGRTTITIAHRLSTIVKSDRVAVLHEGKIVSCGHHLELLKNCGFYQTLFAEQYIKQEAANA